MANPATQDPDFIELELDPVPAKAVASTLPAWAKDAITKLATVETIDGINTILAPLRAQPESPGKVACRAARDAAWKRIADTKRAALLATLALVWFNLWGWLKSDQASRGLYRAATSLANVHNAPGTQPTAPRTGSRERPYNEATYTKLRSGEWGGRIRHAANRQVAEGDFVLVTRKNGSTQLQVAAHVWWSDGTTTLVSLGDAPKQQDRPAAQQRQAIPVVTETELAQPINTGSVESELAGMAAESAHNASVAGIGSMAGGQLRGVGFSSADGYVTALRNGVKAATAEAYKQTLRYSYKFTDEQMSALVVTIIPESTLPVGQGITHTPSGTAFHDMTPAERRAIMRQTPAQARAKQEAQAQEAKARSLLITGLVSSGKGLVVSPGAAAHGVSRPASQLRAALEAVGRGDLSPRLKSSKAQFGEVMGSLNGNGLTSFAVARKDVSATGEAWPADVVSRWKVGTRDGRGQLGSMGQTQLVAELTTDGEIRFVGGSEAQRAHLTREFEARITEATYNATDLLNWFRSVLAREHHALTWGGFMFVPGTDEQVKPVQDLIAAVKPLMGRSIAVGYVMSEKGLVAGLAESLYAEAMEIVEAYGKAHEQAQERERAKATAANKKPDEIALAVKRANVLPGAAATLLKRCAEVAERIEGYAAMLGVGTTKPARSAINDLRKTLEPLCDDTSLRGAMLELE